MSSLSIRRPSGTSATPEISQSNGRVEAATLRTCQADYELVISVHGPGPSQVDAVIHGGVELALVVEEPAILVPFRIGDTIPWTLAWWEPQSGPHIGWDAPSRAGGLRERRARLDVLLVDTGRDAVRATRSIDLWLDFTRHLDAAVREQARINFDPSLWKRAMSHIRRRFPTPESLATHSKVRTPRCG